MPELPTSPIFRIVADRYRNSPDSVLHPRTRFAPSPTGDLHLGHVVHALWVWGVARDLDGTVIVRIEDHDRTRSSRDSEQRILDDMEWLGFQPHDESLQSLRSTFPSRWRQSDHAESFAEAAEQLERSASVYGCTCTRADLGPADESGERNYPGTCRGMPRDRGEPTSWRVQLPNVTVPTTDLLLGKIEQHPAREGGDVVIRDARGQWTYQLCVVVDDILDGIDLIVRGEDLASSTGRQQLMGELLGRTVPVVTLHHPLVLAPNGRKLSKRDRSETVASMRERGMTAGDVLVAAMRHVVAE